MNVKNTLVTLTVLLISLAALGWSATKIAVEYSTALEEAVIASHSLVNYPWSTASARETLELTFAGDLMAHTVNFRSGRFGEMYEAVSPILRGDDLSFVNIEFPVDPNRPYSTYPRFNVHPEYVDSAIAAGFDVFSAANNHTADWHRPGIHATVSYLDAAAETAGIAFSGIRREPGREFAVTEIERKGRRIGFIAVTAFSNEWREYAGVDQIYLVNPRSARRSAEFLTWLRDRTDDYDLFILSYHGGVEYAFSADPAKLAFFHKLVDAGVDIVWGHHPHVMQPWERVVRSDGSHALILPSTGNFVSGQPYRIGTDGWVSARAATGDSALYEVQADRIGESLRLSLSLTPIIHRREGSAVTIRMLPSSSGEWSVYEGQRRRLSHAQRVAAGPQWLAD